MNLLFRKVGFYAFLLQMLIKKLNKCLLIKKLEKILLPHKKVTARGFKSYLQINSVNLAEL